MRYVYFLNIGKYLCNTCLLFKNIPEIANNLTTTTAGKALDATQGKALNDKINNLPKYVSLKTKTVSVTTDSNGTVNFPISDVTYTNFVNAFVANVSSNICAIPFSWSTNRFLRFEDGNHATLPNKTYSLIITYLE